MRGNRTHYAGFTTQCLNQLTCVTMFAQSLWWCLGDPLVSSAHLPGTVRPRPVLRLRGSTHELGRRATTDDEEPRLRNGIRRPMAGSLGFEPRLTLVSKTSDFTSLSKTHWHQLPDSNRHRKLRRLHSYPLEKLVCGDALAWLFHIVKSVSLAHLTGVEPVSQPSQG